MAVMSALPSPGPVTPMPSVWVSMRLTLIIGGVGAGVIGALVASSAGWAAGVSRGLILGATLVAAEALPLWWLRRALRRFAAAFEGVPHEAWARWTGDQGLRWPTLGISVSGRVSRYHVGPLVVALPEESYTVAPGRALEAGPDARRRAKEGPETWTVSVTRRRVVDLGPAHP